MLFLITLLLSTGYNTVVYAQNNTTETTTEIISINDLILGEKYSREQIFVALGGEPDKIIRSEDDPNFYEYYYGEDVFFQMGNEFYGGTIESSRFYISKGIRVGDNIEKINQLKGICTAGEYPKSRYAGAIRWKPTNTATWDWQIVTFYHDTQGLIAGIKIHIFHH